MGGFDWAGFITGYGAIITAFFFAWVVGLTAKVFEIGGE